ncbi:MAG: TOBE-like domain-containing protein [Proteobacteria bacterium]|nr:TOBE-like domain-containing protein [Pseudomonadota bacterium]
MTLEIRGLTRKFAGCNALEEVDLSIAPGEFLALLGPSGSGKTTLLRILAGLDFPDGGEIKANGRDLLSVSARDRKVGLVFQHYALFRHLTVAENVAFGLRVRRWRTRPGRAEISARVETLLERVQLAGLGSRYPAQLSGGQRQRVALARALAVEPDILLLDEPFGALDAKVRVSLRRWLRGLHEELGLTTIFVTHDQEEALELSDRIAVMNRGRMEQVDTPERVYHDAASPFVCEFIGSANRVNLSRGARGFAAAEWMPGPAPWGDEVDRAIAYVRPQHLALDVSSAAGQRGWLAQLRHIYLAGSVAHLELDVPALKQQLEADVASEDLPRLGLRAGMTLHVSPKRAIIFPASGSEPGAETRWVWNGERAAAVVPARGERVVNGIF